MSTKLKATHEGKLKIGEITLNVAVLQDGTRIITQSAVFKAFGRTKRGRAKGEVRVLNRPAFIDANNLQPYIDQSMDKVLNTIVYKDKNHKDAEGYNAEILPKLCKVYLDAREDKALVKQQMPLVRASEVLLIALSKIGIIALVDEATGYQYDREAQELQRILKAYISEELLSWQQRFPHEFYREIFRLRGWAYTSVNIRKKPSVVGHWTNKLIYAQLPKGVLAELKSQTPKDDKGRRKHQFHRLLTSDIGHPHLEKQLAVVIALMNISKNWKEFIKHFNTKFGQQEIQFDEVEEVRKIPDDREMSKFNKVLKIALNYNPNKDKS